jgi:alpha-galactosidase/6-phospho-beta-glucosidase family protein
MFTCSKCLIIKKIDEFPKSPTKLGHKKKCRKCWSQYMKEYYNSNPQKYTKHKKYVRENDIKYKRSYSRHHIEKNEFDRMIEKYNGKCHACKHNAATCIDHDHSCCSGSYSCGQCIRGVLCNWCNSALGHANDSVENLTNLIKYLNDSRQ